MTDHSPGSSVRPTEDTYDAGPHAVRSLRSDLGERPFLVIWEVTRACGLVCRHCRADAVAHRDPRELDTDEGRRLLDDIAGYGAPRPIVVLTGGDPFQRSDLVELLAHGSAAGLHMSLSPSVTPLLTRDALSALRDAGARAISLSLDGRTAASHDGMRGVEGVFGATLEAARHVRELGFRLQINTTVTADNVTELPGVLDLVLTLGATLWSVFFLVPTGRGSLLSQLSADDTEVVLHWLHDVSPYVAVKSTEAPHFRRIALQRANGARGPGGSLRRVLDERTSEVVRDAPRRPTGPRPPLDVNAGRGFAFIDHLGTVYPSGFLPASAGSVRRQRFSDIYRDAPLLQSLRAREAFTGRCGQCEFHGVCGGSRSQAYAATGDPLGDDPTCAHRPGGAASEVRR